MQEAEPNEHLLTNDVLLAPSLNHERVELGSRVPLLLSEGRLWKHRNEILLAARLEQPERHTVQAILDMYVVSVVLDAFVDFRA